MPDVLPDIRYDPQDQTNQQDDKPVDDDVEVLHAASLARLAPLLDLLKTKPRRVRTQPGLERTNTKRYERKGSPILTQPLPTLDDWQAALELKRRGVEWCGPCPLCGGEDRFHVRPGHSGARVGCRGCIDGQPEAVRHERFGELLRAVFGDRNRQNTASAGRKPAYKRVSHPSEGSSTPKNATEALAGKLWAAGERATLGSPAGQYLVKRWCWPPEGELAGGPLPPDIRWLNRRQFPARVPGFPAAAEGLLLFGYRPIAGGDVAAVSLEALQQNGDRMDWRREKPTDPYPFLEGERWRRTYGSRKGAAFEAAPGVDGLPVVLCEGEVTALACRWLHPGCRVLACGGTSGLEAVARKAKGGSVVIEVDGDPAGQKVARMVQAALPLGAVEVRGWDRTDKQDAADMLKSDLEQRAAVLEYDGGMTRIEADRTAWTEHLKARDTWNR